MRVAFVDDSVQLLEAYKDYFSRFFSVETYLSASVALQEIPKKKFDIVVIDWYMPEMLGGAFLKKLRGLVKNGNYIFHTSNIDPATFEKMLNLLPNDIISKNEPPRIVLEKIRLRANIIKESRGTYWCGMYFNDNLKNIEIDDEIFKFTDVEYRLLRYIVGKDSAIVPKKEIALEVWGQEVSSESIEYQFSSIRKKLGKYSDLIQTKKGEGYFLNIYFWDTFQYPEIKSQDNAISEKSLT